jgi:hypothetical protein
MYKLGVVVLLFAMMVGGCANKPSEAELAREIIKNKTKESAIYFLEHKDRVLFLEQEIKRLEREPESVEQQSALAKVRNELATIYPFFKTGEDQYGNAILTDTPFLSARIRLMEQEAEAYLAGEYD